MYKIDLHTHSYGSPDGSLKLSHYKRMLESGALDIIAVTDHNKVEAALTLQKALGDCIIVGEEITTTEGEIIGLFLRETVPGGLTPKQTIAEIRKQNGLVYVPHPFETVRKGLSEKSLAKITGDIDILEVHNGRAVFQNHSNQAGTWVKKHEVAGAASSDAHGYRGWGKTYTCIAEKPTRKNLVRLLAEGSYAMHAPGVIGLLYPKINRAKSRLHHTHAA